MTRVGPFGLSMPRRSPQRSLDLLFQRVLVVLCWGLVGTQALLLVGRLAQSARQPLGLPLLVGPLTVAAIAAAAALYLRRTRPSQRATDGISALAMILLTVQLAVMQIWIPDPVRLFNFVMVLVVAGVFQRSRTLYLLVLAAALGGLGFGWSRTPLQGSTAVLAGSIFLVATLLGLLVHLLVNAMVDRMQRLLARLMDARERIGQLEELIPICSHCKKMRNDRGYWEQVETYLGSRTHAAFTHGVCPDCLRTHYPELEG